MMNNEYGMDACYEAVEFDVEFLKKDPIRMLGEFTLRAEQDIFFNKTMITALKKYIADHDIKWNTK